MRTNSLFSFFGSVFLPVSILTLSLSAGRITAATDDKLDGLTLAFSTTKQSYILGEPIALRFTVKNKSNLQVNLPGLVDVYSGTLLVFVAFEEDSYRLYRGPGWLIHGTRTIKPPVLDPGGSIETTATILQQSRTSTR